MGLVETAARRDSEDVPHSPTGIPNSRARQELNQQTISDSSKISIFGFRVVPFRLSAFVVN